METITVLPNSGSPISGVTEGDTAGPTLVGKFSDSDNTGPNTNCSSGLYHAVIHWGDSTSSDGTVACEHASIETALIPTGIFDVGGDHVYTDSGSYVISVTVSDTEETETSATVNADTASVSDADLEVDGDNRNAEGAPFAKVEGDSLLIQVAFFDNNSVFPVSEGPSFDSSITTTINWGDGSAVQSVTPTDPPRECDCLGDVFVSATHVYDATKGTDTEYTISVTAKDDGGATVTDTLKARISDAALTAATAKHVGATATQATSLVVASFADAAPAQAAAADFTAAIKWGDGSTSAGTLSKTASGAFDVSGSHSYASAGTKTLSVTVTDEEGQTVTVSATATVGAAPVVLPLTGQPKLPVAPSSPLLALILGLMALMGGLGGILTRRLSR